MKKTIKMFTMLLVIICLFAGIQTNVLAASVTNIELSDEIGTSQNNYQSIIDKLNAEYGTDVHFATKDEMSKLGIEAEEIDISAKEFEAYIRSLIEANLTANHEAQIAFASLETQDICESGSGSCVAMDTEADVMPLTAYRTIRTKEVAGSYVRLTAIVNDTSYWKYSSIEDVYCYYIAGENTTPPFFAETYNYSLIDARRTCALKLYGYTMGNYAIIIDANAYRYVEFWAGSGMS